MLLRSLSATNARGDVLDLPLQADIGFHVLDIKGLDPVKAVIVSSSFANMDGEQYHSSRREARNIVISLSLDPDYAVMNVEELRAQLYSFFMPKSAVTLNFELFDRFAMNFLEQKLDVQIQGRIETFESPLFVADPQVDISIMCFNPDFVDPALITFNGSSVNNLTTTDLVYDGTVDTGVLLTFSADRAVPGGFEIYHTTPSQELRSAYFVPSGGLASGDVVTINSVRGNKYAKLKSGPFETSSLYAYLQGSAWLELQPGINKIRVYAAGAPVPYKIEYTNKYGGL